MEQKSEVIGTTEYLVTQMDAVSALKVQTKLLKLMGPGALELMDEKSSVDEKVIKIIPKLMENFDDEIVNDLVLSLFEKGVFEKVNGTPKVIDFSTHFAGKAFEMWKVVGFILKVNFTMGEL